MEKDNIVEQKSSEKVSNNIFAQEARTIHPVTYFFISLLNSLVGFGKWLLDLLLSMVLSLVSFFKMVGVGAYKCVLGVINFFKTKVHQFKNNDKYGRLSFFVFGASSFSHKQYVNGVLYVVFQVAYILLFIFNGVHSIGMLRTLGTVTPGEDPNCPPDEMFCEWVDGDNSIMILIYGLIWVLSIFVFFYIWNRSVTNGYFNYRVDNFLEFEALNRKNIPFSQKLDQEAKEAFKNGVSLKDFKESKKAEVEAYIDTVDEKEKEYTSYLINSTFNHSYAHLKEMQKQEKVLEKLVEKKNEIVTTRAEGLAKLEAENNEKLEIKVEVYKNKTLGKVSQAEKNIKKQEYVMQEITKRYSCFVETQHTKNNDKYGKFNNYYKYIADLDTDILFYRNFDKFQAIYSEKVTQHEVKNKENLAHGLKLLDEMNDKLANTQKKFDGIRARRLVLEQELEQIKEAYKQEVADIQANKPANKAELLLEAKAKLIDATTINMRKMNDLPTEKNVKLLEKEEIREAKAAYKRDKKYLKTNYTAKEYALEEVINSMVVEYRIDYKVAVSLAKSMFVKEKESKETRFLTNEEVENKLNTLVNDKNEYIAAHPNRYAPVAKTFIESIKGLFNENFHVTILALPVFGIVCMSILPLLFSILVAFTNYSAGHLPPTQLFTWIGLQNFETLFNPPSDSVYYLLPKALLNTVSWTLIWAIVATFSNYILGIVVALMINKDGIKFKKLWRTVFVLTIAIPQFISLLSIGTLLKDSGAIGTWYFQQFGTRLGFGTDASEQGVLIAKIIIIIINIWVGIPYTILSTTGILLNIPKDLYESAKVDGAGTFTQFTKITMPYILFVTGPHLITQFIGNINNFNVIFFLTGGGPTTGSALLGLGQTDLLITFIYKIVTSANNPQYGIASAVGIVVFIICSFISIVMYNKSGSIKEEDQFQ